ncbi:sensor histidine kinase [Caulobacter sp. NIBR2454]|uniref:sensor histidine kinase n=1 Tax=Caulobacter sp. NIBR2454 TaxID=3015996 RepID=UPI0022B64F50|nr:ATP-binding protein [Caulobacter sp. NIBR2454]
MPDDKAAVKEQLSVSEYRYRNMFAAMTVSFWELDFSGAGKILYGLRKQGVSDLRRHFVEHPEVVRELMKASIVLDVNDKSVSQFGAESHEVLLGPVDRYWPVASENVFAESVIAALAGQPYFEQVTRLHRLDGSEFDVLFTASFPRESVERGILLIGLVDLTDTKRAQDEVARVTAELAHAARVSTLGELTASIAHEVNQPLAAIVTGEASLRWLNRPEPDLNEAKAAIGRMIQDGQRASGIIARIRAMSTKTAPEPALLDVNTMVSDATLLVQREIETHGIKLIIDLAADLPPVKADPVQLQQVVMNLLVNAIQAMAACEPCMQVGRRLIARTRPGAEEGVRVEVVDAGPGIEPDKADQLFNAFFTTKATGMGMGLSICKSIIEAHGGKIWAAPKPGGRGAVFAFTLPAGA